MSKRISTVIMAALLLLTLVIPTFATEPTQETAAETAGYSMDTSGSCGDSATWQLVDDHTLIISGSGAIDPGSPWEFYKDTVYTLILDGEITSIGDKAFYSFNNLKYIDFGPALREIGVQAFYSCSALEAIRMPASFRKFGQESFMHCDNLQIIFFEGPMPSFKANCLYTNHTVQLIYTAENPWPQSEVDRLRANFGARLYMDVGTGDVLKDYLAGSNVESYKNRSAVSAPAETQPEPTVPQTLPPETVPPETTLPPLPQATVPEPMYAPEEITGTHAASAETVLPAAEQAAATQTLPAETAPAAVLNTEQPLQEAVRETKTAALIFWALIAAAILTGILVLVLLIRMMLHSSGRYDG